MIMKTLQAWIRGHPGINVLAFEMNAGKSFGFGGKEEVCGFCLASHYFAEDAPAFCRFCRSPLWETHAISDLPEVQRRVYTIRLLGSPRSTEEPKALFIVPD